MALGPLWTPPLDPQGFEVRRSSVHVLSHVAKGGLEAGETHHRSIISSCDRRALTPVNPTTSKIVEKKTRMPINRSRFCGAGTFSASQLECRPACPKSVTSATETRLHRIHIYSL